MYFHGFSKDRLLFHNEIDLNYEQKPVSMVTLFGRQVFPTQSIDEQPLRNPKNNIDLCLPADESVENDKFGSVGCTKDTTTVERSSGIESVVKEESTTNWLIKKNPIIVIDLEEPPSFVSQKDTEPLDDDRCRKKQGFSDKGYRSNNTENATIPRLLDLNEAPLDDPCPDRHYFLQDLNCPYTDDPTPSSDQSGIEYPTPFCSPRSQNVLDKDGTASPASYTSCCTSENNSRIKSRSSVLQTAEPSCRARLEYPETEVFPSETTNECCNEEDSCEMSSIIQMAAESLVHISSQHQDLPSKPESRANRSSQDRNFSSKPESRANGSSQDRDFSSKPESRANGSSQDRDFSSKPESRANGSSQDRGFSSKPESRANGSSQDRNFSSKPESRANGSSQDRDFSSKPESRANGSSQDRAFSSKRMSGNPKPTSSYDSYELLTLELTETSHEDNCVSSKALDELNITGENKELRLKLRRGRRMKNFQKEILPSLVSLSRHEIREDINVLEAVLRSREYKKMQGKIGNDKCEANPRKRRSGQRYVGRRRRRSE